MWERVLDALKTAWEWIVETVLLGFIRLVHLIVAVGGQLMPEGGAEHGGAWDTLQSGINMVDRWIPFNFLFILVFALLFTRLSILGIGLVLKVVRG